MKMEDKWVGKNWSADELSLIHLVEENEKLFYDMLFRKGTITYDYVAVKSSTDNGLTWVDDEIDLPEKLEFFSYTYFDFRVEKIDETSWGCFYQVDQSLTIAPDYLHNEKALLHELIHLHEFVLNDLPMFYHDAYLYCLYKSLQDKIEDLDERIKAHGHLWNEEVMFDVGGLHDILFLLKSYDLDLKKGYKLGTVFGYGYNLH